jgi:hypothetical protein
MPRTRHEDDEFADEIKAIRRRSGRSSALITPTIAAGIAAGVTCAVVLLVGWLIFRHPNESEAAKQAREMQKINDEWREYHERTGTNSLGDAGMQLGIRLLKEKEEEDRRKQQGR